MFARRLKGLSPRRRRLLLAAGPGLFAAWAAVKLLPFRKAVRLPMLIKAGQPPRASAAEVVSDVAWAVRRADRALKVFNCLHRALTAQALLRAQGVASTLHYGAAQSGDRGLYAHVWVTAGGLEVVGCETADEHGLLASFAA